MRKNLMEPLYVDDLKTLISDELNVSKDDVEIITPKTNKSLHTVELVEFAIKDVIRRKKNGETIDYVWVFYDKAWASNLIRVHENIL